MRRAAALALALLWPGAGAAGEGVAGAVAAHRACAEGGHPAALCARHVTEPCLNLAADAAELAACRAAMARALEAEAAALSARLAGLGARDSAAGIADAVARRVAAFCDAYAADARPEPQGHAARCKLMAAHLTVHRLATRLAALEPET